MNRPGANGYGHRCHGCGHARDDGSGHGHGHVRGDGDDDRERRYRNTIAIVTNTMRMITIILTIAFPVVAIYVHTTLIHCQHARMKSSSCQYTHISMYACSVIIYFV